MIRARRRLPWRIAAAAILATCVGAPSHAQPAGHLPRTIAPLSEQTTDETIARDLATIAGWQARIDALGAAAARDPWRDALARGWLRAAREEYEDNDRTGFPQAAFGRAVFLINALASGDSAVTSETVPTAVPPHGSLRVADSLYAAIESIKRGPGFACASAELGEIEAELAWAGNEQLDQGDCKSSPHLARALELTHSARLKAAACGPQEPVAAKPPPRPAPARADTVAVPALPTIEELQIPMNVHFGLAVHDLGAESRRVIDGIAELLVRYPSITVRLQGHTDSRGAADYNLALSRRRVNAVKDAFVALGIDSVRIATESRGKSALYATEDSKRGFALNRRVEMIFVDHEGRDIKATRQESDLQLEKDRPAPKPRPRRVTR